MSKLTLITDRALERALDLAHSAGDGLKSAGDSLRDNGGSLADRLRHSSLGDSLKNFGPTASDWFKTGAALGAVKTGGKVAGKLARRNPTVSIAAAAVGVGLLGYAVYRRAQKKKLANGNVVEGKHARLPENARREVTPTVVTEHSDIGSDT